MLCDGEARWQGALVTSFWWWSDQTIRSASASRCGPLHRPADAADSQGNCDEQAKGPAHARRGAKEGEDHTPLLSQWFSPSLSMTVVAVVHASVRRWCLGTPRSLALDIQCYVAYWRDSGDRCYCARCYYGGGAEHKSVWLQTIWRHLKMCTW